MKFLRRFPYWYLIAIPLLMFSMGVASNQLVLVANHGKFPVMINEVTQEEMCTADVDIDPDSIPSNACDKGGQFLDGTHSIMGPNSHLKILSDIFPLGGAVFSIGDAFIFLGEWLLSFTPAMWLALTIRKMFVKEEAL